MKRLTHLVVLLGATFLVSSTALTKTANVSNGLIVHEWGTFTSVSADDGQALQWLPLDGPSDLPCFVHRMTLNLKSALSSRVRMETPVLYFYSPREMTLNVAAKFRNGLVTEWFPDADVVRHGSQPGGPMLARGIDTSIEWTNVRVFPAAPTDFRTEKNPSHYYAARHADAAPIEVSSEREKFLFYRGVGEFVPPVSARLATGNRVIVNASRSGAAAAVMLFENHDGQMGYRLHRAFDKTAVLDEPNLDNDVDSPEPALEQLLIAQGLYAKEARAMVETWRDSWFEEGVRLFYILSQPAVDAILPLQVTPHPAETTRVFVGRIELITPEIEARVARALAAGDRTALEKFGRFLDPIATRVTARLATSDRTRAQSLLQGVRSSATARAVTCQ